MRRRQFITLLGGAAAAWPLTARAQQVKVARIGFLGLVSASSHANRVAALRAGLRDLGWVEGQNILIEFRWAEGDYERLPGLAGELVRLNVDVLVTHGAAGALAAKKRHVNCPNRHYGGWRYGYLGACIQSLPARRKHHRIIAFRCGAYG